MTYFSRVYVNPRQLDESAIRAAVAGAAYFDHALLWRLFAGDHAERDFVFRSDKDAGSRALYYIVSRRAPCATGDMFTVETKPYAPKISEGETLQVQLRANPTIAVGESGGSKSKRHDVLMHAKHLARASGEESNEAIATAANQWLMRRALDWGLEIVPTSVMVDAYTQHKITAKGRDIAFSSVDYQAIARVVDSAKLTTALMRGVGRAKAFGCGLLLVRRIG